MIHTLHNRLNKKNTEGRYHKFYISFTIISIALLLLLSPHSSLKADDERFWKPYSDLLKIGVSAETYYGIDTVLVDYEKWRDHPLYLNQLTKLQIFDPSTLETKEEKLAYWINVYNIAAIKLVLDKSIKSSIKERSTLLSTVWNIPIINIYGTIYSLGQIEHDILRKMNEPRFHFAIVCASLSCPDLRGEAYSSKNIYSQLEQQEEEFIKNTTKGMEIRDARNTVMISHIFKWFKSDFGGRKGVNALLAKHTEIDLSNYRFGYLQYNWKLNKLQPE